MCGVLLVFWPCLVYGCTVTFRAALASAKSRSHLGIPSHILYTTFQNYRWILKMGHFQILYPAVYAAIGIRILKLHRDSAAFLSWLLWAQQPASGNHTPESGGEGQWSWRREVG